MEQYGEQIPVTFVDGRQHDYWRVDEARLRAALRPADPEAAVPAAARPRAGVTWLTPPGETAACDFVHPFTKA